MAWLCLDGTRVWSTRMLGWVLTLGLGLGRDLRIRADSARGKAQNSGHSE